MNIKTILGLLLGAAVIYEVTKKKDSNTLPPLIDNTVSANGGDKGVSITNPDGSPVTVTPEWLARNGVTKDPIILSN